MNEETKDLTADSRHFILATSEYLSTSNPRYKLISAELVEGEKVFLCLFGLDLVYLTTKYGGRSTEEVKQEVIENIGETFLNLVVKNNILPNKTYYGTHLSDGSFEMSDQKPSWEDGHWGTKME